MADGKDTRSFFRKVVSYVVNPAQERGDGDRGSDTARESEFAKSELKAMIERKRRNDFVRKRELDMLRKLRRQGLTPEQLAALGNSSGMADTEGRLGDTELPASDGLKAKIDAIEQQMVAPGVPSRRRAPGEASTAAPPPGTVPPTLTSPVARPRSAPPSFDFGMADTVPDAARLTESPLAARAPSEPVERPPLEFKFDLSAPASAFSASAASSTPGLRAALTPPASTRSASPSSGSASSSASASAAPSVRAAPGGAMDSRSAVEVSEAAAHDPELDEAVMAYANGETDQAERSMVALLRHGGPRSHHLDTWLTVFDLYRATGQQDKFDTLVAEFVERFGRSAPHWFSVPRLMAEQAAATAAGVRPKVARIDGQVGWVSPDLLNAAAVDGLRQRTQLMPLPWVFDWGPLKHIDPGALPPLLSLTQHWAAQPLDMRWLAGEQLLGLLAELAPVGVRDADPDLWRLRLQCLRLANRPDQFDEVAIDYCVTYEVSPPSWEPAVARVRLSGAAGQTQAAPLTVIGDATTSFVESQLTDEPGLVPLVRLELSGQLVGDIEPVLRKLDQQMGAATLMEVSCTRLVRVDFMASGDLLNWVLARAREGRTISFVDTNRLIALFFSAIGIDSHASVKLRSI